MNTKPRLSAKRICELFEAQSKGQEAGRADYKTGGTHLNPYEDGSDSRAVWRVYYEVGYHMAKGEDMELKP